ncbi:MAG TPA: carboxypeptidase regulatory-like domain-containing protein, partial [Candidatus Kapabacteria bacterium]|nr:carboxypeptidase regulatory-like domain-containing protein [Candidatus Kapabacteria bacterium]
TVQGKVTDGSTGDIMRSVTVELLTKEKQSTKKGAYSDVTGKYTIKKVQQGVYSLRFRYVGFESKLIENVEVAAGKTVTVNVTLSPETKKSTEVVVTARANKESKEAILAQRKNSAQVSDGVSKEEISRLPDADAGQALKRVSGVTLVGDKFIYVRGSSDRYSNTTLNGSTLTSTEPDKRSFDFGMFPSEFLQQANITKSFTPDLPGNFAGGLVQLQTIDFPDGFSVKASLSTSGNNNTQIGDNIFSSYQGGSDDWLARDDGTRSMSSATPGSREDINRLLLNARRQDAQGDSARTTLQNFARGFNQNVWTNNNFSANPNTSFALSFSNLYDVFDNDLGVIASVNYGNSYAINSIVRSPILADKEYRQENAGSVSTRSVNYGGMANIAYKLGGHSSLSFKNVFNRSADDETTLLQGRDIPQGIDIRPSSWQFVQKELFSTQVNGEHTVPFDSTAIISSLLFDWRLGYSQSLRDEPDFRRLRYSRQSVDSTLPFTADIQPTPQGDGTLAGRFYSSL